MCSCSIKNPCDECIVDVICLIGCDKYKNFIESTAIINRYNNQVVDEVIKTDERYIRLIKLDIIKRSPDLITIMWGARFEFEKRVNKLKKDYINEKKRK